MGFNNNSNSACIWVQIWKQPLRLQYSPGLSWRMRNTLASITNATEYDVVRPQADLEGKYISAGAMISSPIAVYKSPATGSLL